MPLKPLDIPAGFHGNGTDLEESNKWNDGSLVRWLDGSLRPVGGWRIRIENVSDSTIRGMHAWQANDNTAWLATATYNQIKAINGGGDVYDITPEEFTAGRLNGLVGTGYGNGLYGWGLYGVPIAPSSSSVPLPATTADLDNFGDVLLFCSVDDGRIWEWDLTTTQGSELVTNGTFDADTDWTKGNGGAGGSNWIIANDYARYEHYKPTFDASDDTIVSDATDTITITGHRFEDGDEVVYNVPASPAYAIGGLTDGSTYYVVSKTTNTFKLSATSGGAAINLTFPTVTVDADDPAVVDVTTDKVITANTFANGDYVIYDNGGGTDINGLVNGNSYYIVNRIASEFQLSLTSGGAAINLLPKLKLTFDGDDAAVVDAVNDKIIQANTFTDGDEVLYDVGGGVAIGGLTDATNYFIINATATEFQLSATSGGSAINLTPNNEVNFDGDDAAVVDITNDKIVTANTFSDGDEVVYSTGGGVAIGGLTDGSNYFIVSSSASEFQLAATSGGTAITLTANNSVTIDSTDTAVVDLTNDKIITANTFSDGDVVTYDVGGGTAITGLTDATDYYIINSSATEFQLSATSGGAAIDLTAVGVGTAHVFRQDIGSSHTVRQDIGSSHSLEEDIGSSHVFKANFGDNHELDRQNFGNLEQTVSGLVATPDAQDTHEIRVRLIDLVDVDSDPTTSPDVNIKITGTTSTTVLVDQELSFGDNTFRFGADDTEVKIEVVPNSYNTSDFYVDTISLKKHPVAELVDNAPVNNLGIIVTEERFIFALGSDGNSRKVAWCDFEDRDTWTPSTTNQAGSHELQTSGQIMSAARSRGQTLVITDFDAHAATYVGPPYVYTWTRVGTHCGAVSRKSAVTTDLGVFWCGQENFFYYDGNRVQVVPCDVHDHVFNDFNSTQQSKVWGFVNGAHQEVWWFYPSSNSTECDKYVAYDFMEKHWLIGDLERTSGVSRGVFAYPIMAGKDAKTTKNYTVTVVNDGGNKYNLSDYDDNAPEIRLIRGKTYVFDMSDSSNSGHPLAFKTHDHLQYTTGVTTNGTAGTADANVTFVVPENAPDFLRYYCTVHGNDMGNIISVGDPDHLYDHEVGHNYDGSTVYAETGPLSIGSGDQIAKINSVIPDEKTQGDVQMTFKTRFHPNDTERSYGPFDPSNPTSVRFSGRQVRMRVEQDQAVDWRVGIMRLETIAGGRR